MAQWFAVHTKPRLEATAEENLERQQFEVYLPRCRQGRSRRGRFIESIEPLFPRYLFIRLALGQDNISTIRSTTGVSKLVQFGHTPESVPDALIDGLKANEEAGQRNLVTTHFEQGDAIQLLDGPFAGLAGIFQTQKSEERVMVLLSLLGRDNLVTVARQQVAPAR